MPNVVRFALSSVRDLYVPGAGYFEDGILDVPQSNTRLVSRARYLTKPFGAVELGVTDSTTPHPALPATGPGTALADPYPQYPTLDEVAAAVAAGTGPLPVALRAASDARHLRGVDGRKLVVVAGTVRNPASGATWATIEDANHRSLNVSAVTSDANGVYVNYSGVAANRVVSFVAGVDETLARAGFSCGASVSKTEARIEMHCEKSVSDYVSYNGTTWVSANGIYTGMSFTAGVLTLAHESIGIGGLSGTGAGGSVSSRGGAARAVFSNAGSATVHNSTKVEFYDPAGALLTTPTTDMKFVLTRQTSAADKVNPLEVYEGRFVNSNIWFVGIFETA